MKAAFDTIKRWFLSKKLNDTVVYIYTLSVVLYQLFYQIMPIREVIHAFGLNAISSLLAVLGLGLFVWDLVTHRQFLKTKLSYVLIALIGVMGISALIRFEYGLVNNAKAIIWQVAQMLVIFPLFTRLSKAKLFSTLRLLLLTFSAAAVPAVFVSFYQYFMRIHYTVSVDGGTLHQGFMGGRLFGVFGSMHFTTLILITMAAFAVYFAVTAKKTLCRVGYILLAVLYFVYSTATGTRSVIVGTLCAVLLTSYFVVKKLVPATRMKQFLQVAMRCLAGVAAVVVVFFAFSGTAKVLEVSNAALYEVIAAREEAEPPAGQTPSQQKPSVQKPQTEDPQDVELDRTDVDIENISNNRFAIWGEYLDIVFDKPISAVFGLSLGEYQKHITNEYADKYIVQYIKESHPSMFARGYIYDTHSAYIGALVMTGVAGVAVLFVFLILGLVKLLKALSARQDSGLLMLFAVLVFILVTSFFDSDLFFRCTSTSVLFWLIAGFALKSAKED